LYTTYHCFGGQDVQELLGDVPATDVVPERSLETVAGIDVDGIEVRLLLEELPHGVDGARISADALLSIIAGAAGGVRGFEPADNRNRSRD